MYCRWQVKPSGQVFVPPPVASANDPSLCLILLALIWQTPKMIATMIGGSPQFSGGDLVTGASNVSSTMATGKDAARAIDIRLSGRDRLTEVLGTFDVPQLVPLEPEGGARHVSPELEAARRRTDFAEVMVGLSQNEAMAESSRCLRCDVRESCTEKE